MNGSRSKPPHADDRSSLDALSRTIEGLEARIEGLMGGGQTRVPRQQPAPRQDERRGSVVVNEPSSGSYGAAAASRDAINEIRQRKSTLDRSLKDRAGWERSTTAQDVRESASSWSAPGRELPRERAVPRTENNDQAMREIARALIDLRQDLKQDISDGVQREMQGLRTEIRNIRTLAEDRQFAADLRDDMARLASSIDHLEGGNSLEVRGLRAEFDELRAVMDNLAREDSVQRIDNRWSNVEASLRNADTASLQDEIVSLAYRLDDIKAQLGSMSNSPAIAALEDKLLKVAGAMEQIGLRMQQPDDEGIRAQFSGLDRRLDEISRAIAASGRSASSSDPALMQRLESRLAGLADQIDTIGAQAAGRANPANELAGRIDALAGRIEELASERAANRLEERLDQLSFLVQKMHKPAAQPELTGFLTDISRKIDALDQGAVGDALATRLDNLARRIEDLDSRQKPVASFDDSAFRRLEARLGDIASRLEETATAVPDERVSLRGLEDQIAHLSSLISQPQWRDEQAIPAELDRRMASIEEYMASNDEYIIEAARQAAEAVVEAYSRNGAMSGQGNVPSPLEMETLSALADDLRNLEEIGRNRDERTHQTFEALHDTLVQIATRLDSMDTRISAVTELPRVSEPAVSRRASEVFSTPDGGDFDAASSVAPVRHVLNTQADVSHIRTDAPVAEAAVAADTPKLFSAATFAADTAMAMDTAPVQAVEAAQPEKTGLLAGLSKRFRPSARQAVKAAQASSGKRETIESAPSIDPVDVLPVAMPDGMDDELLEPGSGAPDVKKILERVRASQTAAENGAGDAGRVDYIAAARRAAQAAAQETAPVRAEEAGPRGKARGVKPAADEASGSILTRYRRPILMAVGAVLLAVMAMPLVRTLTGGESAPPPAAEVIAPQESAPVEPPRQIAPGESGAVTVPQDLLEDGQVAGESGPADEDVLAADGNHVPAQATIDHRTVGGVPMPLSATGDTGGETIIVPEGLEPKALADAAASGDRLALFEIAARFTEGRGVKADLSEAARWYALSAARGLAPAQYRLGNLYEKGTGVARDLDKARQFYIEAAAQGNASAMHNLAVLYASAPGATPDYKLAGEWFIRAADLGVKDSQFNLAILYARGNGVPQDLEESYKWFAIAASEGDEDAGRKRDEVAKAMRPEQLDSARATVAAWKPKPLVEDANSVSLPDAWVGPAVSTSSIDMSKAIRNVQAILNNNGFDAGQPDGKMGKKTVNAIKAFQKSVGQQQTGEIDDALVKELLARNK